MKLAVITNRKSSSFSARIETEVTKILENEHEVSLFPTEKSGHASELAANALKNDFDCVIVLSGDGTLNEAANGLLEATGGKTPNCALVGLPAGSTNVFARGRGFSNDVLEAADELLRAMRTNQQIEIGLGRANNRYFLFGVGVGFDAAVVEKVERRGILKRFIGHGIFLWNTMLTWAQYIAPGMPKLEITYTNPETKSDFGYYVLCMNADPYTYIGDQPLSLSPGLSQRDGLAVLTVDSMKNPTFPMVLLSAITGNKKLRKQSSAHYRENVLKARVHSDDQFPFQVDGEFLGKTDNIEIEFGPGRIKTYTNSQRH